MSLTPFLGLSIVKRKTKSTFSELAHDIDPKHLIDFFISKSKNIVNFLDSTKIESTCICSAFLITS
jgi:hypothetical protein